MGGNSSALNEPALKDLINTPFNGRNYSQQVRGNTDDLARDLRDVLKRGFFVAMMFVAWLGNLLRSTM